jgi:hypothetical protein
VRHSASTFLDDRPNERALLRQLHEAVSAPGAPGRYVDTQSRVVTAQHEEVSGVHRPYLTFGDAQRQRAEQPDDIDVSGRLPPGTSSLCRLLHYNPAVLRRRRVRRSIVWILTVLATGLAPMHAALAWTPDSQIAIADWASKIVPPALKEQLDRHRKRFHAGVLAAFRDTNGSHHEQNADGSGQLETVITQQVERAIGMIERHYPFEDVVYQMGLVSHYVADADSPMHCDNRDPMESRYRADFQRYAQSTQPRLTVVFYGIDPVLDNDADMGAFLHRTLDDCRSLYPSVGEEYRRIGFQNGTAHFDDRSTAFGVVSVAYSKAVSDIVVVLRYIWLRAGGADRRPDLPTRSP